MNIKKIFIIAIKAVQMNKVRSFLTMLGVIIGVGSVVLLTSIGTGLQLYVQDQFTRLGTNTVFVVPGTPFSESGGFGNSETAFIEASQGKLKQRYSDKLLRDHRDLLVEGAVTALGTGEVSYKDEDKKVTVIGVTASYANVGNVDTLAGEWFTESDDDRSRRIAMLGYGIAEELFGEIDPVNKNIKIDGRTYRIMGVLEEQGGGFGGPSFDNYIYLPINTLFDDFNTELIDNLSFRVVDETKVPEAIKAIEKTLGDEGLEEDDFSVFDQAQLLETIQSILGVLTLGLGGISAISLVVGGIGIMNIMLVSVTERTREIGLRKALGATPKVILIQFLFEAALLSVIGGMIGVVIAYLGSLALQSFFPARVTIQAVILAFGVSTVVGLVFGAAPARRASKLSPIEALRYE